MEFIIREATLRDARALSDLGQSLFSQTFAHCYKATDLHEFLSKSHSPEAVVHSIKNGMRYKVVSHNSDFIGYMKYGHNQLPISVEDAKASEIMQLYIHKDFHRYGLGRKLLNLAFSEFKDVGVKELYLGVWSENYKAQAFYEAFGFKPVACYWFKVGTHIDREIILRRDL